MSLSFFTSLLHSLLLSFQFLFPLLENVTFATGRPTCDSNYGVPDLDDCHYIIRNQLQRDDLRFRAFAPNIDDMSIANVGRVMPGYFISNNGDNGGVGAGSAGGTGAGAFPIIRGPLGRISTAQIAGMTVSQRAQFYSSLAVAAALQGIPRNDVVRPAGSVGSVGTSGGAVGTTPSAAAVNMMAARMRAAGEYSPVNVQRLFRIEHGQCKISVGLLMNPNVNHGNTHEYSTMANIAGAATEITASCVDQVPVRGGFVFTGQSNKLFIQISYLPSRSTSLSPPSNPSSPIPVSDRFAAALNNAVTDPATSNAAQSVQGEGQDGLERSASAETIDYGNGYQTENYCNFDTGTGCRWGFSCVQQPALKNTGVMFGPTDFTASVCLTDVVGF